LHHAIAKEAMELSLEWDDFKDVDKCPITNISKNFLPWSQGQHFGHTKSKIGPLNVYKGSIVLPLFNEKILIVETAVYSSLIQSTLEAVCFQGVAFPNMHLNIYEIECLLCLLQSI
jgi:hypothetical protein